MKADSDYPMHDEESDTNELMAEFLPEYRGRCVNDDCPDNSKQRVLSLDELDRTYPATGELPYTPLPPQATHVCDRCGMVYSDWQLGFAEHQQSSQTSSPPPIEIEEVDWEPERVFQTDLRTASIELVEACPDEFGKDELVDMVRRWVPGFGKTEAEDVIEEADVDVMVHDITDYM